MLHIELNIIPMPTKKRRLDITLEPRMIAILSGLAKKKHKSVPSLAVELIEDALERAEDIVLSKLSIIRDVDKMKTISHRDAWK